MAITVGTKTALTRSATRCIGARDAWADSHQLDDLGEGAVRAQVRGAVPERAGAVERAADDSSPGPSRPASTLP